jgi:hypothetical protein
MLIVRPDHGINLWITLKPALIPRHVHSFSHSRHVPGGRQSKKKCYVIYPPLNLSPAEGIKDQPMQRDPCMSAIPAGTHSTTDIKRPSRDCGTAEGVSACEVCFTPGRYERRTTTRLRIQIAVYTAGNLSITVCERFYDLLKGLSIRGQLLGSIPSIPQNGHPFSRYATARAVNNQCQLLSHSDESEWKRVQPTIGSRLSKGCLHRSHWTERSG